MFKKYYKAANDDIKTNRELIDKIMKEAEKPVKTKAFTPIYKFGMSLAAMIVLAISVSLLYNVGKNDVQQIPTSPLSPIAQEESVKEIKKADKKTEEKEKNPMPSENSIIYGKTAEPENEESGQQIEPIEPESPTDIGQEQPVLAMETGDGQGFALPRGRIGEEQSENKEKNANVDEWIEATQMEAETLSHFFTGIYGEKDDETGFIYGFDTEGKIVGCDETLYFVRMRWLVDNNHWSTVETFVVNESLTELYNTVFLDGSIVYWNTEVNLITPQS